MPLLNTERALASLGRWRSKWHLLWLVVYAGYNQIPASWHMFAIVFIGIEPSHHCKLPSGVDVDSAIPRDDNGELSQCTIYVNYSRDSNETVPCPDGWSYGDEVDTIVNKWDLVCDRSYLVPFSQTILVFGVMTGAALGSIVSDAFGRKTSLLLSGLCISTLGIVVTLVDNFYVFIVLRFMIGLFQQGMVMSGSVITSELCPADMRTAGVLLGYLTWPLGILIMTLMAYFVRTWTTLMIMLSLPGFVAILMFWLAPESIPWLVAKGREAEAKLILRNAASWNKVVLPAEFHLTNAEEEKLRHQSCTRKIHKFFSRKKEYELKCGTNEMEDKSNRDDEEEEDDDVDDTNPPEYSFLNIFKNGRLLAWTLSTGVIWTICSLVYYGLSFSAGSLSGSIYLNMTLYTLAEFPSKCLCVKIAGRFGRRITSITFFSICTLSLLVMPFISNATIITTCAMIGKFGITSAWILQFLWVPEFYPTTIRNLGIGIASVCCRIGNSLAPFSMNLVKIAPWTPYIVFGGLSLIACLLSFMLPETLHRPLPVTIQQIDEWSLRLTAEEIENAKKLKKSSETCQPAA